MHRRDPREYSKEARSRVEERSYNDAAFLYDAAASGHLMWAHQYRDSEHDQYMSAPEFGQSVTYALGSILCYRLSGDQRSTYVATRANAAIREISTSELASSSAWGTAHEGLCEELLGDVATFMDNDDPIEHYRRAKSVYETVENDIGWQAEVEFGVTIIPLLELSEFLGCSMDDAKRERIRDVSLLERIKWKTEECENLISKTLEHGELGEKIF
ncbi:hypothetical protein [Halorarum salinum]|uniref:Uncharacterized protein n=1 Tax=Halorarum salinum TaxID=2743089 RepID=A0A7D5L8E0_9EURY|nr:hypothetical protein [Halobaculum salinum]QLG60267.1 hypothetical protein HUG12_00190 [Halobaculum salinum]